MVGDETPGCTRLSTRNGENRTRFPATKPAVTTTATTTSRSSDVLDCMPRACVVALPMARPCPAFNVSDQKSQLIRQPSNEEDYDRGVDAP